MSGSGCRDSFHAGWLVFAFLFFLALVPAEAARIGELTDVSFLDRSKRFFTLQDPSLRYALAGSMLLGICCGLMGCFLVMRRMSLMGDAISHAVLPGIVLGFLWSMSKNPLAIFVGATLAGLLGAAVVQWIQNTTRQKEDAALGFVLASFFGLGICLLTMLQGRPGGNQSGLSSFLFGQAAAMGRGDVILLAVVTLLVLIILGVFFKEFVLTSFDAGFARSLGWPVAFFHYTLMLMLAFAIVSSLQAVGVVLVSAMLVIPASAAYLLTRRMKSMVMMAALFGMFAGVCGTFFSFTGKNLPTGPLMVLAAAGVFTAAFLFAPRHGILSRWWLVRERRKRVGRENSLKALYRILEDDAFRPGPVLLSDYAGRTKETLENAAKQMRTAARHGLLTWNQEGESVSFTPKGWQRAAEIVRNHRLWELYLANAASIQADHVHEDAEQIEHILGDATVRALEKRLGHAVLDPHGKPIPQWSEIHPKAGPDSPPAGAARK